MLKGHDRQLSQNMYSIKLHHKTKVNFNIYIISREKIIFHSKLCINESTVRIISKVPKT